MKLIKEMNDNVGKLWRLTQHVEGDGGLSQADVVLAGRHLAAVLPRVFLGDRVDGQRGAVYLCPLCVCFWGRVGRANGENEEKIFKKLETLWC